jgi:uncharacterized membrane protein
MAEEQNSRELLTQLVERLDHLERVLQSQTARLYAVEQRLGLEAPTPARRRPLYESLTDEREEAHGAAPQSEPRVTAPSEPRAALEDVDEGRRDAPHGAGQQAGEAAAGSAQAADEPRRSAPREGESREEKPREQKPREQKPRDLESVIGGSWFSWVGIIAVTFGVAFALKYAFENEWVGPGARVALGGLGGLALLGVAERLRRRGMRPYAYVLSGGGLLILYLSIYAAYDFYGLLAQPLAFLLMTLVTAAAVLLSVRLDALPVAVLGLVGGFLTPVLIRTGQDNQAALFTYVALLDAGVLSVAYFKRWRVLDFLSFAATVLMTLGWAARFYNHTKLWPTLVFVTLFFVLYSLLAVFHNVLPRRRSRWFDVALLACNATLYFGFSYLMLAEAGYERTLPASLALVVSAFFVVLFYAAWNRCREDRLLVYAYVGAAVTFFTAAVAIQLELQWVTVVWSVEALMLTWVGLRSGEPAARRAGLGVYAAALLHWFAFDAQDFASVGEDFVPLLNARALSCAALVGSLAAAAWLYRRATFGMEGEVRRAASSSSEASTDEGRAVLNEGEAAATFCALAANGLAVALLTLDLSHYFGRRKALAQGFEAARAENGRQFSLTALWSIYGATLVAYGARRHVGALRWAGLALLALATVKVLTLDLSFYGAAWHVVVLNQTFMAFALVVGAYALSARFYAREGRAASGRSFAPALVVAANVLMIVALSAEAYGYFESRRALAAADEARLRDLELAKQLSLSVVWALYGAGLLIVGRVRRSRPLRLMALALLGLTTLKVFFFDLSGLESAYRIVSFIVLGAILLAVSYLYQKTQRRAAEGEG